MTSKIINISMGPFVVNKASMSKNNYNTEHAYALKCSKIPTSQYRFSRSFRSTLHSISENIHPILSRTLGNVQGRVSILSFNIVLVIRFFVNYIQCCGHSMLTHLASQTNFTTTDKFDRYIFNSIDQRRI